VHAKEPTPNQTDSAPSDDHDCEPGTAFGGEEDEGNHRERTEAVHGQLRTQLDPSHATEYAYQRHPAIRHSVNIIHAVNAAEQDARLGSREPIPGENVRLEAEQRAHSGNVANGGYWS